MLVLQDQEWLQIWEKCSCAHRHVDEQPSKRSKKKDDKSAVAVLKKYELHDRTGRPVVYESKYRNCNTTNSPIPIIFGLEDTIQKPSDYLF